MKSSPKSEHSEFFYKYISYYLEVLKKEFENVTKIKA